MQSSQYIPLIVGRSADTHVQELIRKAERDALIKSIKSGRPSRVAGIRVAIGHSIVGFGRWFAGRPKRRPAIIEVESAYRLAR
jgi:hypothetical protein